MNTELAESLFGDAGQPVEPLPVEPEQQPEPQPQPEPDIPPAEPVVEEPKKDVVPLAVFLEEKDRRKAAEQRAEEFERQRAQPQTPQAVPDPVDDPDGFNNSLAQREQRVLMAVSERFARKEHGSETVDEALKWANDRAAQEAQRLGGVSPFAQTFCTQEDPVDWIVRQHKQSVDLEEYSRDPVAFARRILDAQGQATVPAAVAPVAAVATAPVAVPPRSIARASSATAQPTRAPVGAVAAVEGLFQKG